MSEKTATSEKQRKAEFIAPSNILKAKVGDGGLSEGVLKRAQAILDSADIDFKPLAINYLDSISETLDHALAFDNIGAIDEETNEVMLNTFLYPALELKSHGTMFQYPMITRAASDFVRFLEFVRRLNSETLDVIKAYHKIMYMIATGSLPKYETDHGDQMCIELNHACTRYFEKHHKNDN